MSRPRALIIEDNSDVAEFFAMAVTEAGYDAMIIRHGHVALRQLPAMRPDLVVLDLRLPRVSGAEILKAIRADPELAETSVFVVTAHWEDAEQTIDGADLVLLKPIDFLQLRDLAARFRPREEGTES